MFIVFVTGSDGLDTFDRYDNSGRACRTSFIASKEQILVEKNQFLPACFSLHFIPFNFFPFFFFFLLFYTCTVVQLYDRLTSLDDLSKRKNSSF